MGGRARKPLPLTIQLKFNTNTGFYEGDENGITYQLTFEQMNDLKNYFRASQGFEPRITTWYNSLSRWDKPKVKQFGGPGQVDDSGFYPDE